jgi:hypothetical protein
MAVLEGGISGSLVGVGEEAASPLHVVSVPVSYGTGGVYRVGAISGTMTADLAANSEIFQFRYVTAQSRFALVRKVTISAGANVAATAAALITFCMTAARSWSGIGTGGTRLTLTGDNVNLRTTMNTSEVNDIGVSSTGALTAGSKTLDATNLGAISFGIGTGALTTALDTKILALTKLFDTDGGGDHPLMLANQEGFIIRLGASAMPPTMTWHFSVNVFWAEVPAF